MAPGDVEPAQIDAIILGCVATKNPGPAKAKDLYASPMFAKRRRYAEMSGKPWFVFSTHHGIIGRDDVIEWYDVEMSRLPAAAKRAKGSLAAAYLEARYAAARAHLVVRADPEISEQLLLMAGA